MKLRTIAHSFYSIWHAKQFPTEVLFLLYSQNYELAHKNRQSNRDTWLSYDIDNMFINTSVQMLSEVIA